MDTPTILLGAADVLTDRGLFQGAYMEFDVHPDISRVCTLGAINIAAGLYPNGHPRGDSPLTASTDATNAHIAFRAWLGESVGIWNDADGRTTEQATAAVRECAAELAGGQS